MWWGGGQDGVKRGTIRVGGERDKTRLEGWTRQVGAGRETRHGLGTRCDGEGDKKRWEGGQTSGFLKGDSPPPPLGNFGL